MARRWRWWPAPRPAARAGATARSARRRAVRSRAGSAAKRSEQNVVPQARFVWEGVRAPATELCGEEAVKWRRQRAPVRQRTESGVEVHGAVGVPEQQGLAAVRRLRGQVEQRRHALGGV